MKKMKTLFFSLIRNICNILNTRSSLSCSDFQECSKLSAIHFGLPSITHLSMESKIERQLLCNLVEKSINAFEHRLNFINVDFTHYDSLKKEAKLSLKAEYNEDDIILNLILKISIWEFIVYE
jgi:type VI secretion system lysozyme-like protein